MLFNCYVTHLHARSVSRSIVVNADVSFSLHKDPSLFVNTLTFS